jgi:predicted nucleotide-binding protein (sugar kinase/HSP70/actin superfamily)
LEEKKIKEIEKKSFFQKIQSKKQKIVLISHPYNLYDEYVNLRIKEKLEKLGVEPIFIDGVPINTALNDSLQKFTSIPEFHWEFGKKTFERIQEILKYDITGAIEISSFACGCDAVLKEFIEKEFKTAGIPFLYLIIDEHTGEAGFQTRLEAFIDTI